MAVTFTNKATQEMRERLARFLGARAEELWVSTFHSAALRILRRYGSLLGYQNDFVIYDDQDSHGVLKALIRESGLEEKRFPPAMFARVIDQAKNSFILPAEFSAQARDYASRIQADIYDKYQCALMRANAMDFGDLLVNVVRLFREHPHVLESYQRALEFVLVDEFQDTNLVQYDFVRMLTAKHRNLLVVGDDDQSIYSFRGATIRNILEFERDFPDAAVVTLDQNYRSTGNVLAAAHGVICKNPARKPKKLWTAGEAGEKITAMVGYDEGDEAQFVAHELALHHREGVPYRDMAIFYRTNAQSRALEEALMNARIPYRIFGGMRFYDRKEIRDILAYLRLILNPKDDQSFLRIVNTPPRGIGAQTIKQLADRASAQGTSLLNISQEVARGERATKGKGIAAFVELMDTLTAIAQSAALAELIDKTIKITEYEARLKAARDPQSESRLENLLELVAIGRSMELSGEAPIETLRRFMDRVSLASSADLASPDGEGKPLDTVSLMTLHLAKGLEYPVVFLTGLEEGLLPHQRSLFERDALEEERRLCYVGITRAMRRLYLTRAVQRGFVSSPLGGGYREVSRFIWDVPDTLLEHRGANFLTGAVAGSAFDSSPSHSSLTSEGGTDDSQMGEERGDTPRAAPAAPVRYRRRGGDIETLVHSADTLVNSGNRKRT